MGQIEIEARRPGILLMMFSLMSHLRRSNIVLSTNDGLTAVAIELRPFGPDPRLSRHAKTNRVKGFNSFTRLLT
jgi:hypothetical protein